MRFFRRKPTERRTDKFTLRKHEYKLGVYYIVRVRDGKVMQTLSELRRAGEHVADVNLVAKHNLDLSEMPLPEWKQKILRIEQAIEARREQARWAGAVKQDAA